MDLVLEKEKQKKSKCFVLTEEMEIALIPGCKAPSRRQCPPSSPDARWFPAHLLNNIGEKVKLDQIFVIAMAISFLCNKEKQGEKLTWGEASLPGLLSKLQVRLSIDDF